MVATMEGQMTEIRTFLEEHLKGILGNDISSYEATTSSDLTLYEWYVTPHRIDGLPFHEFMMIDHPNPHCSSGIDA